MTLSEESLAIIRKKALEREALKRSKLPLIVEDPSPEDIQTIFKHTFADKVVRMQRMCDVAEKTYQEIMDSPKVPARLVEVLNQTLDGLAKEVGARTNKQSVEHTGSVDTTNVHVYIPDREPVEEDTNQESLTDIPMSEVGSD